MWHIRRSSWLALSSSVKQNKGMSPRPGKVFPHLPKSTTRQQLLASLLWHVNKLEKHGQQKGVGVEIRAGVSMGWFIYLLKTKPMKKTLIKQDRRPSFELTDDFRLMGRRIPKSIYAQRWKITLRCHFYRIVRKWHLLRRWYNWKTKTTRKESVMTPWLTPKFSCV